MEKGIAEVVPSNAGSEVEVGTEMGEVEFQGGARAVCPPAPPLGAIAYRESHAAFHVRAGLGCIGRRFE
jgi:hypothetical protein